MPEFTQEHRTLKLATPLGEDVLLIEGFRGEEAVSSLFRFDLECISKKPDLDFDEIIGKNVTVSMGASGATRYINGYVSRFRQGTTRLELTRYYLEVVPWLWFLTLKSDCRIFQDMTVPDILKTICDEMRFTDIEKSLQIPPEPRVYCVQYRETSFDFISRLLESEGIRYHFRHENGKHAMVLSDSPDTVQPCPGRKSAWFNEQRTAILEEGAVFGLSREKRVHTTKVALHDFNFETPRTRIEGEGKDAAEFGALEKYSYPGGGPTPSAVKRKADLRIEEEASLRDLIQGASDCKEFTPGFKFDLKAHPRSDYNQPLMLLKVTHEAKEGAYQPGGGSTGEFSYENRFEAIPANTRFRPARKTPTPVMQGTQTAVVSGPQSEEIYTDKYGRVKVKFHWDRLGKFDDQSSCWVRVSQGWAGKNWGMVFLPRIGQEVIVDFLEGDPDAPIITGRVHNAEAMPPYDLPGAMTKSGIKTKSTPDGGSEALNILQFEDKKDHEHIFLQAQKNLHERVKNSRLESVGLDHHVTVKRDRKEQIKRDRHQKVSGNVLEECEGDVHLKVGGSIHEQIEGDAHQGVSGSMRLSVEGHQSAEVAGDRKTLIEGKENLKASGAIHQVSYGTISIDAGGKLMQAAGGDAAIDAGANVHVRAGANLVLEAGAMVTIKAGGSFITVGPSGVALSGAMLMLNSGGSAGSGQGALTEAAQSPDRPDPPDPPEEPTLPMSASRTARAETTPGKPPQQQAASPQATALRDAAKDGRPFCKKCEEERKKQESKQKPAAAASGK